MVSLVLGLPVVLVDFADTGGEEFNDCGDVFGVCGFGDLVNVVGGNGEDSCGGAARGHAL